MCLIYTHFNLGDPRWFLMILSLSPLFPKRKRTGTGIQKALGSERSAAAAFGAIGLMTVINACLLLPLLCKVNKAVASPPPLLGGRAASVWEGHAEDPAHCAPDSQAQLAQV